MKPVAEIHPSFQRVANAAPRRGRKRNPPFSIRLTPEEREQLEQEAGELALGAYAKAKIFGGGNPIRTRRTGRPIEDKQALAQALALLGQSRLSSNLNQLAKAVNMGTLPLSPEVEVVLKAACDDIRDMKALLVRALGLEAGGAR